MIYVFLAKGFEEIEALTIVDILRRAELEVATVGIGSNIVEGAHGIPVMADVMECEVMPDENCDGIVLPGGMPGTLNLEKSKLVQSFIDYSDENKKVIGAICAAPTILGHKNLLVGKKAVCFPGCEEQLLGAEIYDGAVVTDGNITTGKGPGVSIEFALELVRILCGEAKAKKLESSMQCSK